MKNQVHFWSKDQRNINWHATWIHFKWVLMSATGKIVKLDLIHISECLNRCSILALHSISIPYHMQIWPFFGCAECAKSKVGFHSRYWLYCHSNLRVSRTNLRWLFREDIKFITFRTFETSLVKQLKKKCVHKNCAKKYWLPISLFTFCLKFFDQRCYRFSEGYPNNISTKLSS